MKDVTETKKSNIPQKKLSLTNKKTGEIKAFILRSFQPGDEEGMLSCVKEEHENTYFKAYFYDPVLLRQKAESGEYIFFVAEEEGEIVGIELLRIFHQKGEDYIEPASQIIRRDYRGFGLSEAMVDYTFAVAKDLEPSALFVHAAMYHSITQHVCESYGMEPVGFEIGSFLTEVMKNSFAMEGVDKYSAGTLCYPVKKKCAGRVYLPKELAEYAAFIYDKLGAEYEIETEKINDTVSAVTSEIDVSMENEVNRYISITIHQWGDDLLQKISQIMAEHENEKNWTYLLVVNIDTPEFLTWYKRLKERGFFFGGMQPLCGEHERVFLYWVGDLELQMERYRVTEKFSVIRDKIEKFYKGRVQ